MISIRSQEASESNAVCPLLVGTTWNVENVRLAYTSRMGTCGRDPVACHIEAQAAACGSLGLAPGGMAP